MPSVISRKLHQTIRKVTQDMEELRYNTAIAALMEYVNVLRRSETVPAHSLEPLIVLLAPLAPHIAEECWERLGRSGSVFDASWPVYDEMLAREEARARGGNRTRRPSERASASSSDSRP